MVSQPPDLLVYTDVNRDLVFDPAVDKREVLLTRFKARNHDHSLHSVTGAPDGKWYFNNGNCGAKFTDRSGRTFRLGGDYYSSSSNWFVDTLALRGEKSDDGFMWTSGFSARINSDGTDAEIIGHGYRNSYEHCTTSHGELFQNDNDDPPACHTSYVLEFSSAGYFTREGRYFKTVKRPGQDHARAHWRQDDPGTFDAGDIYGGGSPTGIVFYENGALGERHAGTLLSCEPPRNVVFAYQPEMRGAIYRLDRSDWLTSNTSGECDGADFTHGVTRQKASSGGWEGHRNPLLFRPSDIAVGADGAIYIADWFDPQVGGHATLDASASGTIYRVAPKGFKPVNPEFDLRTIEDAITALRSPAINVRWTGFQGLKQEGGAALDAVTALIAEKDKNHLESIGLGGENHENEVWTALRTAFSQTDPMTWSDSFIRLTWRLWLAAALSDFKACGTGSWVKFGLQKQLKETGIYDPDKIQIVASSTPRKPASTKFSEDDVVELQGDATRGKSLAMRCIACHQIDGVGPDYGPDLKGWVSRQGPTSAVAAIVNPSADIAHGFQGTAILLDNDQWLDGIAQSTGDPMFITSMGGLSQMVPGQRIKSKERMKRSLMLNADQLGLSAQDVADIVEWLKSY